MLFNSGERDIVTLELEFATRHLAKEVITSGMVVAPARNVLLDVWRHLPAMLVIKLGDIACGRKARLERRPSAELLCLPTI